MSLIDIKHEHKGLSKDSEDVRIIQDIEKFRKETAALYDAEEFQKAYEKTVEGLRRLHDFSDYSNLEFRVAFIALLFDLSEIHYALKDYKQSKKNLDQIFRYLEPLLKFDPERFGRLHVLAMELSTRILRSRKRMLETLAKQQEHTGILYEKVNAGVAAATTKLVDSLCKAAELMASTGDYKGALRFYMEAVKLSKKRTGRVTEREVAITIAMARIMLHSRQQLERAKRLLDAIRPHAVSMKLHEAEENIDSLIRDIESKASEDSKWRAFLNKVQSASKYLKWEKKSDDE